MVANLLRLKLQLLRNGLRRGVWQIVALAVGLLYGLGAVAAVLVGAAVLGTQDPDLIRTVLVLAGTLLVAGWWLVPLFAFGVDQTLEPARFAVYGIPRRELVVGLALAGLIGVPGVVTALGLLAVPLSWWQRPGGLLGGLLGAVLAVALCVVGSRATTTALAPLVSRRRYREVLTIVVLVPLFLLGPLLTGLMRGIEATVDLLPAAARVLGWTPFGAAFALPADLADGQWAAALAKAAICLVTVAALLRGWGWALERQLVNPVTEGPRSARAKGLGVFGRLPGTPTGAVAARCLTYWMRDPRYSSAVALVPLLPFLLYFVTSGGAGMLLLGPVAAFMLGWTISADVAYDSTAFWTHVAAPLPGRVDRLGRVLGAAVPGVPVTVVFTVASVAYTGRWGDLLPMLGIAIGVLASGLGLASVVSARVVYPVAKPGDNPFSTPQGAAMATMVSQFGGWLVLVVLVLPEVAVGVAAVLTGSALLGALAFVLGVGLGGAVVVAGVRIGGRDLDRRSPELLAQLVSFG